MVQNVPTYCRSFTHHLQLVAYIAAVPVAEAKKSGQLLAAKFFTAVFGDYAGARVLPVFIALSAFGNLISVALSQSRVFREVARQGIFPFSAFFASTKPFGTPAAPMLLKFVLTSIVIIGPR
jgi:amino acid transporter